MATGDFLAGFYNKQIVSKDMLEKYVFGFIQQAARETAANEYRTPGVFDVLLPATAPEDGIDTLIIGDDKNHVIADGLGNTLIAFANEAVLAATVFENANGVSYYFGLEHALVPGAPTGKPCIEINPRLRVPEYCVFTESVGRLASPDSVAINGNGSLTFVIDKMLPGASPKWVGRSARMWLKAPATDDESVAFKSADIAWVGNKNTLTTSAGEDFGQVVVSTDPNDYVIFIPGATVSRSDLRVPPTITQTISTVATAVTASAALFGTTIKAGEKLLVGRHWRRLMSYTDSTHGMLDRAYDENLTGASFSVPVPFFVCSVVGAGPNANIGAISTTSQNVIAFSGSDFDQILRRDSHGAVKARVRACASDSNEPQTSVEDKDGSSKWYVNEKGEHWTSLAGAGAFILKDVIENGSGFPTRVYSAAFPLPSSLLYTINASLNTGTGKWEADDDANPASAVFIGLADGRQVVIFAKSVTTDPWGVDEWDDEIFALGNSDGNSKLDGNIIHDGNIVGTVTGTDAYLRARTWGSSAKRFSVYVPKDNSDKAKVLLVLNAWWDQTQDSGNGKWRLFDSSSYGCCITIGGVEGSFAYGTRAAGSSPFSDFINALEIRVSEQKFITTYAVEAGSLKANGAVEGSSASITNLTKSGSYEYQSARRVRLDISIGLMSSTQDDGSPFAAHWTKSDVTADDGPKMVSRAATGSVVVPITGLVPGAPQTKTFVRRIYIDCKPTDGNIDFVLCRRTPGGYAIEPIKTNDVGSVRHTASFGYQGGDFTDPQGEIVEGTAMWFEVRKKNDVFAAEVYHVGIEYETVIV